PRRRRAQARGHGRRTAARGTARSQRRVVSARSPPWARDVAEIAGLVRRTHRELVEIELAEHPRAGVPQLLADGALVLGHEAFEDVARRGGLPALCGEQVLHPDLHDGHLDARLARRTVGIVLTGVI